MANAQVTRRLQIIIDESGAEKALDRLKVKEKELVQEIEKGTKAGKDMSKSIADLENVRGKVTNLEGVISGKLAPSLRQTEAAARNLHKELQQMSADAPGYAAKLQKFKEVSATLSDMKQKVSGFRTESNSVFSQFKTAAVGVFAGNIITGAAQMISGAFSNAISGAGKLSDEIADIEKATGLTTKQVEALNGQLGKMNTRTKTSELRELAVSLGQAGEAASVANIQALDRINVALGDEFGGDSKEIGNTLSVLRNNLQDIKTGNYAEDVTHIGNALNELGASGLATAPVVSDIANRIAGVAQTFGVTSGEILGTAAAFQELGINTERGSTAYTKLLQKMAGDTKTFAQVAGVSTEEFKTLVNTNINEALLLVAKGSKEASNSNVAFAKTLENLESQGAGVSELLSKLAANGDLVRSKIDLASKSLQENGSIMSEFEKKNNTLGAQLDKLSKNFAKVFNSPAIRQGSAGIIGWLNDLFEGGNKANKAFDEQAEKMATLDKNIDPLLARYTQLTQNTGRTVEEQQELRNIIQQIVEIIPDAISGFDEFGNVLDINREKIGLYVDANQKFLRELEASAVSSLQEDVDDGIKAIQDISKAIEYNNQVAEKMGDDAGDYYRKLNTQYLEKLRQKQQELIKDAETLRKKYGVELSQDVEMMIGQIRQLQGMLPTVQLADASKFDLFPEGKGTGNNALPDPEKIKRRTDLAKKEAERRRKELEDLLRDLQRLEMGIRVDAISDEYQRAIQQLSDKYDDFFKRTTGNVELTRRALNAFLQEMQLLNKKFEEADPTAPADPAERTRQIDAAIAPLIAAQRKKDELSRAELGFIKAQNIERLRLTMQSVSDRIEAEKKLLEVQKMAEIAAAEGDTARIEVIKEKYKGLFQQLDLELQEGWRQSAIAFSERIVNGIQTALDFASAANDLLSTLENNRMGELQSRHDAEVSSYDRMLDQKIISQRKHNSLVDAANRKFDREQKEIQLKQFRRSQALQAGQAAISAALAVLNALSTVHPYPAAVAAAISAGVLGGIQVAAILAAKPPSYGDGGLLPQGSSHAEGGIGLRDNRTGKYVGTIEGGEPIISKGVYAANKPVVDALLAKGWSRDFTPVTPNWISSSPKRINLPKVVQSMTRVPRFADGGFAPEGAAAGNPAADLNNELLAALLQRLNEPIMASVIYGEYEAKATALANAQQHGAIR